MRTPKNTPANESGKAELCPSGAGRLRDMQPLQGISAADLAELQRDAGFHPPAEEWRAGNAFFEIRRDVSAGDAVQTLLDVLPQVSGILAILESFPELEDSAPGSAVRGARALVQQAQGAAVVLEKALYQEGGAA